MTNNSYQQIKRVVAIIGLAVGGFAISAFATDWVAPVSAPPTCVSGNPGCDAPINTSSISQIKGGGLTLCNGSSCSAGALLIMNGTVGIGTGATPDFTTKLDVEGAPIKAGGGLIIETRASDPTNPETGRLWLTTN